MLLTAQCPPPEPLPRLAARGIQHDWVRSALWTDGWSATLVPGLTVVVGGDGAGKTTCLRILAADSPPARGALCLHTPSGAAVAAWPDAPRYRSDVFWCDPASDALDALSGDHYLEHHRAKQPRWNPVVVTDLLHELGLEGHLHKPLFGLSMGMRRKLRLAAALGSGATLTLIDDPLAALDRASCQLVAELMQDCAHAAHRLVVTTAFDVETARQWGAGQVVLL